MPELIVDGYNAVYKIPELARYTDRSLEEARNALVDFLNEWRSRRSPSANITVVFDSKDAPHSTARDIHGIRCVFATSRQDADDKIIAIIKHSHSPQKVTVITADNYVTNNCNAHGATVEKPQNYFKRPVSKVSRETEDGDKKIGYTKEREITEILKKRYGIK
jgi:predicted RNA-binding protein with PIN domain